MTLQNQNKPQDGRLFGISTKQQSKIIKKKEFKVLHLGDTLNLSTVETKSQIVRFLKQKKKKQTRLRQEELGKICLWIDTGTGDDLNEERMNFCSKIARTLAVQPLKSIDFKLRSIGPYRG